MFTQDTPFDGELWFLTSAEAEVVREIETLDHTADGTHLVARVPEDLAHQLVAASLSA